MMGQDMTIKQNGDRKMTSLCETRRWLLGTLKLTTLGGITAVAFLFLYGHEPARAEPMIPSGFNLSSWYENGHGGEYLLQITEGEVPPVGLRVSGVVTSDTDCDPDAQGLSHCHTGMSLANGSTITVIETHMMSRYRCLQPGETVSVTRFNDSWVVAVTRQTGKTE
jgi:hypothetical protein